MAFRKRFLERCRFELHLKIFLVILFILMITGLIVIICLHNAQLYEITIGKAVEFNEETREVAFFRTNGNVRSKVLQGKLGINLPNSLLPLDCSKDSDHKTELCLIWKGHAELNVTMETIDDVSCYMISWISSSNVFIPKDCFAVDDSYWYGGYVDKRVLMEMESFDERAFITATFNSDYKFGPVIHPYWLISSGASLFFQRQTEFPIFLSINQTNLDKKPGFCLTSRYIESPYKNYNHILPQLNYSICLAENLQQLHTYSIKSSAPAISSKPPDSYFDSTLLSTWSAHKSNIDNASLSSFASQFVQDGLAPGRILINAGWQQAEGDYLFNQTKFPNSQQFIKDLQNFGYQVFFDGSSLCDITASNFYSGAQQDFFVIDAGDSAPGLLQFVKGPQASKIYQGYASAVDMNSRGQEWLRNTVTNFHTTSGTDQLAFEGGEVNQVPYFGHFHDRYMSPNSYTSAIGQLYSDMFPWTFVRAGYKSQNSQVFILLTEFNSTWAQEHNGLKAVLPSVITLGIMGYPFVIPDAAGGSSYGELPSKELYIRWVQLNAFLPMMHLSILPSNYDSETVDITKKFVNLHNTYVAGKIKNVLQQVVTNMSPIIRPLWWADPTNPSYHSVADEFLVGDDLLVAPVLSESVVSRDIFLPVGKWCDKVEGSTCYTGPVWIKNYDIPLKNIPYFEKR